MLKLIIVLLCIIVSLTSTLSCNSGRAACMASCMVQNCATGYCNNDVCVCSRCDIGPIKNFNVNIKI